MNIKNDEVSQLTDKLQAIVSYATDIRTRTNDSHVYTTAGAIQSNAEEAVNTLSQNQDDRKLPDELFYKRHQYDRCGVRLKYLESNKYGHYYVKCDGSSSVIAYVSGHREQDILDGKDQDFFLSFDALEFKVLQLAKSLVTNIEIDLGRKGK